MWIGKLSLRVPRRLVGGFALLKNLPADLAQPVLPHVPAMPHRLDAAATLVFQTPLQEHPPAADAKAGALLTVIGLMFSMLASQADHLIELLRVSSSTRYLTFVGLAGYAVFAIGTIIEAFRTIAPRFPKAPPSLAFFGDIAQLSLEEYITRVEGMNSDDALEQMLSYNHTLARICVEKFGRLRKAIRYFQPAFLCWFVVIILVGIRVVFL